MRPAHDFEQYRKISQALGDRDWSPTIIHYTSVATLEAILKGNELWFGKITDLNDTQECDHFLDAVIAALPGLIVGSSEIRPFVPYVREMVRSQTYVSSWCEYLPTRPDGKLSMWRAYADDGSGVGLVVDSSQFLPSAILPQNLNFHVNSSRVDYVPKSEVVSYANHMLERLLKANVFPAAPLEAILAAAVLAVKAVCVKHEGFSEEEEIRFLHLRGIPGMARPETLRHLNGRDYFALGLVDYPEAGLDLRITNVLRKVIVGPKGEKASRTTEVRRLLDRFGLQNVEVTTSAIPYR